ncbi:MAG: hypothetical protein ACI4HI_09390 [Lachnospiraceae bacterium]
MIYIDKKAKDILFKTYWSGKGWKVERVIAPDDFQYAKEKGVMFDPFTITHDDCVKRIMELVKQITPKRVARAFLSSLSTRRLDWRSAVGSYSIAKLLTAHTYTPAVSGSFYEDGRVVSVSTTCEICKSLKYGMIGQERYVDEDLNVLNFERLKWGGVRHGQLLYTLFDLEQFIKEDIPEPTKADVEIFQSILQAIDDCNPGDYPSALRDRLKNIPNLKSNKAERDVIIEILACIGVLKAASYDRTISGRNEWTFAEYWRGEDGYDKETVRKYFEM